METTYVDPKHYHSSNFWGDWIQHSREKNKCRLWTFLANVSLIRRNVAKRLKNVAEHQKYHFICHHKHGAAYRQSCRCSFTCTNLETRIEQPSLTPDLEFRSQTRDVSLMCRAQNVPELPNPPAEYVNTNFQSHNFQDYMWQFKSKVHCETRSVLKQLQ